MKIEVQRQPLRNGLTDYIARIVLGPGPMVVAAAYCRKNSQGDFHWFVYDIVNGGPYQAETHTPQATGRALREIARRVA